MDSESSTSEIIVQPAEKRQPDYDTDNDAESISGSQTQKQSGNSKVYMPVVSFRNKDQAEMFVKEININHVVIFRFAQIN